MLARRKRRAHKRVQRQAAAIAAVGGGGTNNNLRERSSSRLRVLADHQASDRDNGTVVLEREHANKQTRDQLVGAVRKHFNAMSVNEGDVMARFIYVVRHAAGSAASNGPTGEEKGNGFRLRFNP